MTIFKMRACLAATVYIRANTKDEAFAKLSPLLGLRLDLRERHWFSDAMIGGLYLPEISLATAMALYAPTTDIDFEAVSRDELQQALQVPKLRSYFTCIGEEDSAQLAENVFSVDLETVGTAYAEAATEDDARALLSPFLGIDINWASDWITPEFIDRADLPVVISPYFTILKTWPGDELTQSWPEVDEESSVDWDGPQAIGNSEGSVADGPRLTFGSNHQQMMEKALPHLRRSFVEAGGRFAEVSDQELANLVMMIAQVRQCSA